MSGDTKENTPIRRCAEGTRCPTHDTGAARCHSCLNRCFCCFNPRKHRRQRSACVAFVRSKTVVYGFGRFSDLFLLSASSRIFPSHRLRTSPCGSTISDSDTCGLVSFRHHFLSELTAAGLFRILTEFPLVAACPQLRAYASNPEAYAPSTAGAAHQSRCKGMQKRLPCNAQTKKVTVGVSAR